MLTDSPPCVPEEYDGATRSFDFAQRHADSMEGGIVLGTRGLLCTGRLRYDVSPLSPFKVNSCFELNDDGTMKDSKDVDILVNAYDEPHTGTFPPMRDPDNAQKFDPTSNVRNKRKEWYGLVRTDSDRVSRGAYARYTNLSSLLFRM